MGDFDSGLCLGVLITGIAGALAVLIIFYDFDHASKKECEAELPRNVECVWSKPG